ncbi:MAG: hypothetical protein ACOX7Q_06705 [Kiritimatiellia bacterium]|jgi:hypothetical protein
MNAKIKEMVERVERQEAAIRSKPIADILSLPEYSDVQIDERTTLAMWHIISDDGTHQIIIQGYYKGFLGTGAMHATGFIVDSNAKVAALPEKVRLEYC